MPIPARWLQLELALDTADLAALGPFWAALLTGSPESVVGDDVIDPKQRVPLLWFQHTDPHETPRQRFHVDLWVPHDLAEDRIAAAVAAAVKSWTSRTPRHSSCWRIRRATRPASARS